MMMDDHEIRDNWEPASDDRRSDPAMVDGRRSYVKFQRRAGPPLRSPVDDSHNPLWCDFHRDGFGVFMADTRTERSSRTARTFAEARIMSDGQHTALLGFLAAPADTPRIVASPSILCHGTPAPCSGTRPVSALRSDAWDGYPRSLHEVLAFIAHERIRTSSSCPATSTRMRRPDRGRRRAINRRWSSIRCTARRCSRRSPSRTREPCDLVANDAFDFNAPSRPGATYRCRVTTEFAPPGDGFAVLRFRREDSGWKMHCEFDRAPRGGRPCIDHRAQPRVMRVNPRGIRH